MAPVSRPLSVITSFTSRDVVRSATQNSRLLASPYCFSPFLNSSPTDAPLVLWVSLTILIIPIALVPGLIYLGTKFFAVQSGWRLREDASPGGEVVNLSPAIASSSAATTSRARLGLCVGFAFSTLTMGIFAIQGLAAAGMQLCSGTTWTSGIWAAPWVEWGILSGGLTASAIWSTWALSRHWRKLKRRDVKGKGREVVEDEEEGSANGNFRDIAVELQDLSVAAIGSARSSWSPTISLMSRCPSLKERDDESSQPGFASGSGSGNTSRKESGCTTGTKASYETVNNLKGQQYERRRIIKLSPEEVTALNQDGNEADAMKLLVEGMQMNGSPRSSMSAG